MVFFFSNGHKVQTLSDHILNPPFATRQRPEKINGFSSSFVCASINLARLWFVLRGIIFGASGIHGAFYNFDKSNDIQKPFTANENESK